jgi:hypothetical protein
MKTPRKPAIREKPEEYICTEKEIIKTLVESNNKLSIILVGNGDPKKGLFYQFTEFMADHKIVVNSINEIKEGVAGLHTRADDNKKAAETAMSAIEKYKLECKAFEAGAKEREDKEVIAAELKAKQLKDEQEKIFVAKQLKAKQRQDNWQKIIWVIMALIGLYGIYNMNKQGATNTKKIDDLGTPVIVNPRGAVSPLPKGDELKMFPKDFNGDTTGVLFDTNAEETIKREERK